MKSTSSASSCLRDAATQLSNHKQLIALSSSGSGFNDRSSILFVDDDNDDVDRVSEMQMGEDTIDKIDKIGESSTTAMFVPPPEKFLSLTELGLESLWQETKLPQLPQLPQLTTESEISLRLPLSLPLTLSALMKIDKANKSLPLPKLKMLEVDHRKIGMWNSDPGFSWTFKYITRPQDTPVIVEEIKQLLEIQELYKTMLGTKLPAFSNFRIDFNQVISELKEHELEAMSLAGHKFDPTDAWTAAANANIEVLTWMRTRGGFKHSDANHAWDPENIIRELWMLDGASRCEFNILSPSFNYDHCKKAREAKIADIEACADLVFDRRYWSHVKDCHYSNGGFCQMCDEAIKLGKLSPDDIDFPAVDFLDWSSSRVENIPVIQWFLERAQYRYPMPQINNDDVRKLIAAAQVLRSYATGTSSSPSSINLPDLADKLVKFATQYSSSSPNLLLPISRL